MPGARSGRPEGRKETDEREVGSENRHHDPEDLPSHGTHVSEEEPRSRLLGDYSGQPAGQVDQEEDET